MDRSFKPWDTDTQILFEKTVTTVTMIEFSLCNQENLGWAMRTYENGVHKNTVFNVNDKPQ